MVDLYEVVINLQCGLMTVVCLFDRFRGFFWKAARIGRPLFRCFTTIFVGLVHNYSLFSSFHSIFILIFICYLLGTISFFFFFLSFWGKKIILGVFMKYECWWWRPKKLSLGWHQGKDKKKNRKGAFFFFLTSWYIEKVVNISIGFYWPLESIW